MEFRDALTRRRSVRTYADRPVSRDVLERIADAAVVWAPSAASSSSFAAVAIRVRVPGSVTTTIRSPWLNPALGAHTTAELVIRSSMSRWTGRSA